MAQENAVTLDGRQAALTDDLIDELRAGARGEVLTPDDPGYDDARRIWNGMHDRHPALIVRCTGTADVVAAVNVARENELLVSVRGGGHNVAGNAVADRGMMIDLSPMRGIHVDPARRVARAQPGVTWGELDRETQLHSLLTPGGQVSTTGIAGYTLSGGMGMLHRKYGLTCDNLISAEVVTADGNVVTASEAEHPDLFWAIRGGGGNFGVVTSFEFRLYEYGPEAVTATTIYPADRGVDILRKWRAYTASAPDEVTSLAALWTLPPFPNVPAELHGTPIIIVHALYAGPVEAGQRIMQPLRELGEPILDMSDVGPYTRFQSAFDVFYPDGGLYYWKSLSLEDLTDAFIDQSIQLLYDRPSPETLLMIRRLGGAISRVPGDATAFANRGAAYNMSVDAKWSDPAESEENISWTRDAWDKLSELSGGEVYLNFAGFDEDSDALARSGFGGNYERLRSVKQQYDPTNLFRMNVNITP